MNLEESKNLRHEQATRIAALETALEAARSAEQRMRQVSPYDTEESAGARVKCADWLAAALAPKEAAGGPAGKAVAT